MSTFFIKFYIKMTWELASFIIAIQCAMNNNIIKSSQVMYYMIYYMIQYNPRWCITWVNWLEAQPLSQYLALPLPRSRALLSFGDHDFDDLHYHGGFDHLDDKGTYHLTMYVQVQYGGWRRENPRIASRSLSYCTWHQVIKIRWSVVKFWWSRQSSCLYKLTLISRWVSNKWIREGSQIWNRPCPIKSQ